MLSTSIAAALALLGGHAVAKSSSAAAKKPNVVMTFTDDQDLHLNSLEYMPTVQKEITEKGTTFTRHYATVAKCCPSRAYLLRGQAAHNTNITDVHPLGNARIDYLAKQDKPFHLTIAPTAPHNELGGGHFPHYRLRIQTQGVDDMVADVVERLAANNILDNTYVIYTTDNGYHIGNHCVPAGARSDLPGAHVDLAPTFLDIAGVAPANRPDYLHGRSLLGDWHGPQRSSAKTCPADATAVATDVINVEFWGEGR
ncbi:Arylsulfatase [Apiospora phragmitis]|uniref:Arylsulfatase n=1 Tax=Apiospora phragmitis TaxID=2905665 RepID=A0ABR1VZ25_9PEZI